MAETVVQVHAPHFVAGFVVTDDRVTACAPILRRHLLGKTISDAREIIRKQGWKAFIVQGRSDQGAA